ncbi:SGNH hydrolase domain-containing protein [Actinomycetospora aeridis]|uniref:SGNH hydrolase domain-containing protein n=1 Tax=Actinomycetospora aeridis TaxID=3129231 RepID=A0ABU8N2J2_9PSEU
MPTTLLVLAVALLAAAFALPSSWWPQLQAEAVTSALFVQNWYVVAVAPATAPNGVLAGPLAHLWLVAILGQLGLVSLLLVGTAVRLARVTGRTVTTVLAALLLLATAASAAWAATRSIDAAPLAALDTATRVWPFAVGGLIAIFATARSRPSRVPGEVLLRLLAALALPFYLWSGVVLGFYLAWRDRPEVGLRGAASVLGLALVLAVASALGGRAARRSESAYRLRVLGLALATLLVVTVAWHGAATLRPGAFVDVSDPAHPGAVARLPGYGDVPESGVTPGPMARDADWAPGGTRCATSGLDPALQLCGEQMANPAFRVVVVGDSHIEQLLPALRPIVRERRGEVVTMLRGACPFSTTSDTVLGDAGCTEWNRAAMAEIVAMRPAVVVTLASRDVRSALTEETPKGFVDAWRTLDRVGVPVLAIRDNPRLPFSPTECVDARPADGDTCAAPRGPLVATRLPWTWAGDLPQNVVTLDLSDAYCTGDVCPAVTGNVLIYLDSNHVSATFGGTLAPFVAPALLRAVERTSPGY